MKKFFTAIKTIATCERGQRGAISMDYAIELSLFLFLVAAIVVGAITQIETADTASWDSSSVLMWGVVGIIAIAAIIMAIWRGAKGK